MDLMQRAAVDRARAALELAGADRKIAGMDLKDAQKYSLARAITSLAAGQRSGFEFEVSKDLEARDGAASTANSLRVPLGPLLLGELQRDANVATPGAGGYLVATDNVGFIDLLRNRTVALRMGAQTLPGLVGNVTLPKATAAATAYWLANETTQITESQPTLGQITLSPKTVGAYTEISRRLILQSSPAAEDVVRNDLLRVIAVAVDAAVLNGSGASGQPTGLLGTAGIGSVTGTSLDYAKVLEFQTDVAAANIAGDPATTGYVATTTVAALMQQRVRFANTASPLWEGSTLDGTVVGFRAMSSNQCPASHLIFGDWSQIIVGEWGSLELVVNPYADFPAGIIGVRAMHSIDVGVRHPAAFSVATSVT